MNKKLLHFSNIFCSSINKNNIYITIDYKQLLSIISHLGHTGGVNAIMDTDEKERVQEVYDQTLLDQYLENDDIDQFKNHSNVHI